MKEFAKQIDSLPKIKNKILTLLGTKTGLRVLYSNSTIQLHLNFDI